MAVSRRTFLRRRRTRALLLALIGGASVVAGMAYAAKQDPLPVPPVKSTEQILAGQQAEAAATEAASTTPASRAARATPSKAATVPDIPLAWRRIAQQAAAWPAASNPPELGSDLPLPTVPASRVRDTVGLNIDLWRTAYGYRDFAPILAKAAELHLRHARVGMQATGQVGLARMQLLGQIGVRLDVVMGDALGRFDTTPYGTLDRRLKGALLPYVDSVEGTNELDLSKQANWPDEARAHQRQIVQSVSASRTKPVGVIAPSLGRLGNLALLGSYDGLADAGNAHAYSNSAEPSGPLDQWQAGLLVQLPRGSATVVTEAGFQTDLGQRKYHYPLPEDIAAAYTPRIILEAMRRGIPQVYLFEMIDRWSDPFGVDTSAHFGLLHHDLRPKPAWTSMVRLQKTLLDGGRPDRTATPLSATVTEGPEDLRVLAFRRQDGTAAIAIWRAVSQWDAESGTRTPAVAEPVRMSVDGDVSRALVTNVVTGKHQRLTGGSDVDLMVDGSPVIVDGIH